MISTNIFGQTAVAASQQVKEPVGQEAEIQNVNEDTISAVKFSPAAQKDGCFLIATSWAGDVRCWQIDMNSGAATPKAQKYHGQQVPILDGCWSADGMNVFTAGADNAVRMWNLQSEQYIQVGAHDKPIKTVHVIERPSYTCLMTGSWDKSLKFWDLRQPQPILTLSVPERVYCADVCGQMAVVCTADRGVHIYDLNQQPKFYKKVDCTLKYQYRSVSIFNRSEARGFAIGSIEGRVVVNDVQKNDNFSFKCHRSTVMIDNYFEIYQVNSIIFHPIHNTMATLGGDGQCFYWDKDVRTKIKSPDLPKKLPLTACDIEHTGHLMALAEGYDWQRGHEGNDANKKPKMYLRQVFEDMKPKAKP